MTPSFAVYQRRHRLMADAILSSQLSLRDAACCIALPDFEDLRVSQLGDWHLFALQLAVLGNLILHIIVRSTQEEMRRIDARRIVAMVQDSQMIGYLTIVQAIRDAVSKLKIIRLFVNAKDAVSFGVGAGSPEPTIIRFLDLCPEALKKRACLGNASTGTATKLASSCKESGAFDGEGFTARLANQLNFAWGYVTMGLHTNLTFRVPRLWDVPPSAGASLCSI